MQNKVIKEASFREKLSSLFFFTFSDKLKFAIKASLSMVLAYLIPLSQGWGQPQIAATTVMVIAAMGSLNESILKGAMRIAGTIIGAIIGIALIVLFPQDRALYLLSLSVLVTIVLYLARAYKGDMTIFMLTAMTMMMVFKNGEVNNVLIYGLDKTYMTVFGVVVYTLVGIFLWPVKVEDATQESSVSLSQAQLALFRHRDAREEVYKSFLSNVLKKEKSLTDATRDTGSMDINLSQWHSLVHHYKNINAQLILLTLHVKEVYPSKIESYVHHYDVLTSEIEMLFENIENIWDKKEKIIVPSVFETSYVLEEMSRLPHLKRASLVSTIQELQTLHEELRLLAIKLNSLFSPMPTHFNTDNIPSKSRFLWGDAEHLKGALVTFFVFWAATYFWIMMNPLGGFMVVTLATGLSVLTTFTPVKPSILITVFTFSFLFAIVMYVAALPHMQYAWELGAFIFLYSFIAFYFLITELSIAFLTGLFTLNIMNTMYYDLSIFLLILLMFYLFLFILHIFYHVPFSTKPEYLFLKTKNRFFRLSSVLLESARKAQEKRRSYALYLKGNYAQNHLLSTVENMQLWAEQIDTKYFEGIEKKKLLSFIKSCEIFAYLLTLLYHHDIKIEDNKLIVQLRKNYTLPSFTVLLNAYAEGKNVQEIDRFWKDEARIIEKVEESLSQSLNHIDFTAYSRQEIAQMYENISLRRNVWLYLFTCQAQMEQLDFKTLEESRF